MPTSDAILKAVAYVSRRRQHRPKGQELLALLLYQFTGIPVTKSRVNKWINQGQQVPSEMALAIQEITHHHVTAAEIRPDLVRFFAAMQNHRNVMNSRYEVGQLARRAVHD